MTTLFCWLFGHNYTIVGCSDAYRWCERCYKPKPMTEKEVWDEIARRKGADHG